MRTFFAHYLFHWTPEKAIWLGGQTLSWDARCAGIYAGFGIALLFCLIWHRHQATLPSRLFVAVAAGLAMPLFVDVASVYFGLREPVNSIKHLTGVWFGSSFCCLLYPAVRQLMGHIRQQTRSLSLQALLFLTAVATVISSLTHWDNLFSFYLLESLSWFGFSGLLCLIIIGLVMSLRKTSQ